MSKTSPEGNFGQLGKKLKSLRDGAQESLAEASGAVEIDVRQLASYELGRKRPSEDVLLLLISHFGVRDDEAVKIWELAGYGGGKTTAAATSGASNSELKILFTDIVDIMVNNYGVVMNFMQSAGTNSSPKAIARVGMSREHAKSVLQILQVTLAQTEKPVVGMPEKLIAPDGNSPEKPTQN